MGRSCSNLRIHNNGDKVTFQANGNVGIGTTSPAAKLEVSTNTLIGDDGNKFNTALTLIKNGDPYGTDSPVLILKHSGQGLNFYPIPAS